MMVFLLPGIFARAGSTPCILCQKAVTYLSHSAAPLGNVSNIRRRNSSAKSPRSTGVCTSALRFRPALHLAMISRPTSSFFAGSVARSDTTRQDFFPAATACNNVWKKFFSRSYHTGPLSCRVLSGSGDAAPWAHIRNSSNRISAPTSSFSTSAITFIHRDSAGGS